MEYKLAEGYCEQDAIDLILQNIRIVGFGIIGCSECPFSSPYLDEFGQEDINIADPDEGHYNCGLTGQTHIWGENPTCKDENWAEWLRDVTNGD